jgi:endonuclease-8
VPEGDTIARAAARLRPLLVGEPLLEVRHRGAALHDLRGERVEAIETHGKHMWIRLDRARAIHVHLGMEGRWTLLSPAGLAAAPGRVASASLALVNRLGGALCLWAPVVEVVSGPDARAPARRHRLGPDVLAPDLDLDAVVDRALADGARPLGEVLLDQRVTAGIGNLWKSELCFLAGLDPRAPVASLERAALRQLYARAARMMTATVAGEGPRATTSEPGRRPPPALGRYWVYRRAGRPCARCGTPVARIMQGAPLPRSTYFCPRCQVAGPTPASPD